MNKTLKKVLIVVGILAVIVCICIGLSSRKIEDFSAKYADADLTEEIEGMERVGAYTGYINDHSKG